MVKFAADKLPQLTVSLRAYVASRFTDFCREVMKVAGFKVDRESFTKNELRALNRYIRDYFADNPQDEMLFRFFVNDAEPMQYEYLELQRIMNQVVTFCDKSTALAQRGSSGLNRVLSLTPGYHEIVEQNSNTWLHVCEAHLAFICHLQLSDDLAMFKDETRQLKHPAANKNFQALRGNQDTVLAVSLGTQEKAKITLEQMSCFLEAAGKVL